MINAAIITSINGISTRGDKPVAMLLEASSCAMNFLTGEDKTIYVSPELEVLLKSVGLTKYTVINNEDEVPDEGNFLCNAKLLTKLAPRTQKLCHIFVGLVCSPKIGEELFTRIDENIGAYIEKEFSIAEQNETEISFENEQNAITVPLKAALLVRKEENANNPQ